METVAPDVREKTTDVSEPSPVLSRVFLPLWKPETCRLEISLENFDFGFVFRVLAGRIQMPMT